MSGRVGIPIKLLRPQWLSEVGRERLGVELDCPLHPDGHRVRLWFGNPPDDGLPAKDADELHTCMLAECDDLEHLTLLPLGAHSYRPLAIGCWSGWLIEGELSEAKVTGVAW